MTEQDVEPLAVEPHLFTGYEAVPDGIDEAKAKAVYADKHLRAAFDAIADMDRCGDYRALKSEDFDKFCQKRFGFNAAAVRMVRTFQVNQALIEAGLPRVAPRIAMLIYDLPIQQQIEVMAMAAEIAKNVKRGGKAAHWNGKITAPVVEDARKKLVEDSPRPKHWRATDKPPKPSLNLEDYCLMANRCSMDVDYRWMVIRATGPDGKSIPIRVDPKAIRDALPPGMVK